jgi:hypothetical protein
MPMRFASCTYNVVLLTAYYISIHIYIHTYMDTYAASAELKVPQEAWLKR